MKVRPEFADFVSRRTGLSPELVAERAFEFPMTENSQAENALPDLFETAVSFTQFAVADAQTSNPCLPGLSDMCTPPELDHPPSPGSAPDVRLLLHQKASGQLGYSVIEKCLNKGPAGIFSVDLYRRPVTTQEFDPKWSVMTSQKGVLFVDTTPGVPGGSAYLHPLTRQFPHLSVEEKRVVDVEAEPDMNRVRPEVKAALDRVDTATSVDVSRTRNWIKSANILHFCKGAEDAERVACVRVEVPAEERYKRSIPGLVSVPDGGTVALLTDPNDEEGDRIELNGEERKFLLQRLHSANERLWLATSFCERWAKGDALRADDGAMQAADTAKALRHGIDQISLLLTNGDIGAYERLSMANHDSRSWLESLRQGVPPDLAFGRI